MTLYEIRDQINSLDEKISELLIERLSLAIEAADKKTDIEDINREADILSRITAECARPDQIKFLTEIYAQIFSSGKIIMSDHKKMKN